MKKLLVVFGTYFFPWCVFQSLNQHEICTKPKLLGLISYLLTLKNDSFIIIRETTEFFLKNKRRLQKQK